MEKSPADLVWIIMGSALVFSMQAGFAMLESGLTRSKNSINVAIKNLTDFGVSTLCFWIIGFGIMFGSSVAGIFGRGFLFFNPGSMWPAAFLLFQAMFCSTSVTIISGAVAERMRFSSYIVSTTFLSVLVYPVTGHWIWGGGLEGSASGWLGKMGFVDFAGSTAVHSIGGWIALVLLLIIGPRTGRFNDNGTVNTINGASVPQAVLGVFLLWFGWIGFNGASTLAASADVPLIIFRTMLGGSAGMIVSMAAGWPLFKKPDVSLMLNGSLAGLVAVTANCHVINETQAVIIGGIGGLVTIGVSRLLQKLKIDDAVDAIPVHLGAGIWGTLAVGIFGNPELLGTGLTRLEQIGVQCAGILACGAFCMIIGFPAMLLLNRILPLRINLKQEADGLNKSEHGVTTEINDLFTILDSQAKTGDITLRAPVEPFTEAGQIASMYNNVLDTLQAGTVEKGEYINILENVSDGLFLLDKTRKIGPYYSASLETIFHRTDLEGLDIMDVFTAFLDEKARANAGEYFDVAFDPAIAWRNVERLNPLSEADAYFDDQAGGFNNRRLEFSFARIYRGKNVERLFVVVRDTTDKKELADEIEKTRNESRAEMEMLQRILHVDPQVLTDFLESARDDAEAINNELRSGASGGASPGGENFNSRLDVIFRHSHAIKGDAQLISLDFLAEKAEALEQQIQNIRSRKEISPEDFLPLTIACSGLMENIEKLDGIINKWLKLSETVRGGLAAKNDGLKESLEGMAQKLAEKYEKEVQMEFSGFENLKLNSVMRKGLRDILVQLVRNSVYHGIETPDIRREAGKNTKGSISIQARSDESNFYVVYRDDGGGLNGERIKNKAVAASLVSAEKAKTLSEQEKILFIFHPGFSTAENPDDVAGKGVGLAVVKEKIRTMGGKLSLKSRSGSYCEFSLLFPRRENTDENV